MRLTRFQSSALAIRPNTGWTRPGIGGRVKGVFAGVKRRAKNFLARPGIKSAVSRVGRGLGTGVGWAKQKTGFRSASSSVRLAEFRRRRRAGSRRRKPTFGGHTSKGAAYGALSGGALGASLGGAGSYAAARKAGLGRLGALGVGAIGGTLGGIQGGLSGAVTGGTVGATAYGVKRIREDRRRR
jgi:hypothetical protein